MGMEAGEKGGEDKALVGWTGQRNCGGKGKWSESRAQGWDRED